MASRHPRPQHPADALAKLVGQRLRALREQAGQRQADVAAKARAAGLPWLPATLALIEQGKRRVALDEALVLPGIYGCKLDAILAPEDVDLWLKLRRHLALDLALSKWTHRENEIWLREVLHKPAYPKVIGEGKDGLPIIDPGPRPEPLPELIDLTAAGEAELDAADSLKLHPHVIALRAWKLCQAGKWSYPSLTRERDHRMVEAEQQDAQLQDPAVSEAAKTKRRQSLRGHLSRGLLHNIKSLKPIASARSRKRG